MKKTTLTTAFCCLILNIYSQITFSDQTNLLVNGSVTSGVCLAVADMNNDGLDDIVRLNDADNLEIEYQQNDGSFTRFNYGNLSGSKWGLAIADIDENGYNDIICGGAYNGINVLTANGTGTNYSNSILGGPNIFVQSVNFADIDNDGQIDFFACHDDGISSPYENNGSGTLSYNLSLISTPSTVPSDNSGNYGSIWTDYDNDGDLDLYISKCRLGVTDPNDGRRLNLLFQNDGFGNYTEVASAANLQPKGQSWAAGFEDLDNDGDLDCVIINHDITSNIYLNDGDGTFTDITSSSGVSTELAAMGSNGIQVILEDFNNDTYVDIFLTSRGNTHYMFENDGDNTFTERNTGIPATPDYIQSAATGDLNNDGYIDLIAGFANGYNSPSSNDEDMLLLNSGIGNNWSKVRLTGTTSNRSAIGARIEIDGAWGTQIREVRSGESYGTMNSLIKHFGLGSATEITRIVVKWPSGIEDVILNPNINDQIDIIEGETLSAANNSLETFKVYPNPVSDVLRIQLKNNEADAAIIRDINGKELLQTTLTNELNTVNVKEFSAGVYFITLLNKSTSVKTIKLIKE